MATYLTAESLGEAVSRLMVANVRPSFCDFLIVKHAMTQGDGTVTLSLNDTTYMASVRALTEVVTGPGERVLPPFFNPFGTRREARRGWRTDKYPSNGPPDTVNGPSWKRVIEVLDERPRRVEFTPNYVDDLLRVFGRASGAPPTLLDCATWYFRGRDIESMVGPTTPTPEGLVDGFLADTGLTRPERARIFGES